MREFAAERRRLQAELNELEHRLALTGLTRFRRDLSGRTGIDRYKLKQVRAALADLSRREEEYRLQEEAARRRAEEEAKQRACEEARRRWEEEEVRRAEEKIQENQNAYLSAACKGDLTGLEKALAAGVDIDVRDEDGDTALLLALENGHEPSARFLLDRGADRSLTGSFGFADAAARGGLSALLASLPPEELPSSALALAAHAGHCGVVDLLLAKGVDPFEAIPKFGGATALHGALQGGHVDIARAFEPNADHMCLVDTTGKTPFFYALLAASGRRLDGLRFCLNSGADPNHINEIGWSPLLFFCDFVLRRAHAGDDGADILEFLVSHGAKIDIEDADGTSPLGALLKNDEPQLALHLVALGAPIRGDRILHAMLLRAVDGEEFRAVLTSAAPSIVPDLLHVATTHPRHAQRVTELLATVDIETLIHSGGTEGLRWIIERLETSYQTNLTADPAQLADAIWQVRQVLGETVLARLFVAPADCPEELLSVLVRTAARLDLADLDIQWTSAPWSALPERVYRLPEDAERVVRSTSHHALTLLPLSFDLCVHTPSGPVQDYFGELLDNYRRLIPHASEAFFDALPPADKERITTMANPRNAASRAAQVAARIHAYIARYDMRSIQRHIIFMVSSLVYVHTWNWCYIPRLTAHYGDDLERLPHVDTYNNSGSILFGVAEKGHCVYLRNEELTQEQWNMSPTNHRLMLEQYAGVVETDSLKEIAALPQQVVWEKYIEPLCSEPFTDRLKRDYTDLRQLARQELVRRGVAL